MVLLPQLGRATISFVKDVKVPWPEASEKNLMQLNFVLITFTKSKFYIEKNHKRDMQYFLNAGIAAGSCSFEAWVFPKSSHASLLVESFWTAASKNNTADGTSPNSKHFFPSANGSGWSFNESVSWNWYS